MRWLWKQLIDVVMEGNETLSILACRSPPTLKMEQGSYLNPSIFCWMAGSSVLFLSTCCSAGVGALLPGSLSRCRLLFHPCGFLFGVNQRGDLHSPHYLGIIDLPAAFTFGSGSFPV